MHRLVSSSSTNVGALLGLDTLCMTGRQAYNMIEVGPSLHETDDVRNSNVYAPKIAIHQPQPTPEPATQRVQGLVGCH